MPPIGTRSIRMKVQYQRSSAEFNTSCLSGHMLRSVQIVVVDVSTTKQTLAFTNLLVARKLLITTKTKQEA